MPSVWHELHPCQCVCVCVCVGWGAGHIESNSKMCGHSNVCNLGKICRQNATNFADKFCSEILRRFFFRKFWIWPSVEGGGILGQIQKFAKCRQNMSAKYVGKICRQNMWAKYLGKMCRQSQEQIFFSFINTHKTIIVGFSYIISLIKPYLNIIWNVLLSIWSQFRIKCVFSGANFWVRSSILVPGKLISNFFFFLKFPYYEKWVCVCVYGERTQPFPIHSWIGFGYFGIVYMYFHLDYIFVQYAKKLNRHIRMFAFYVVFGHQSNI